MIEKGMVVHTYPNVHTSKNESSCNTHVKINDIGHSLPDVFVLIGIHLQALSLSVFDLVSIYFGDLIIKCHQILISPSPSSSVSFKSHLGIQKLSYILPYVAPCLAHYKIR
jgi:hypothetical protein